MNSSSLTRIALSCRIEPLEARIAPATIFVRNLHDDGGAGTLRMAILDANASAGADTILFQDAEGNPLHGTIKLAADLPAITEGLTITGPILNKSSGLVINGNKHQIFNLTGGDVTLTDLTVTNGQAHYGGGIYINDPTGTITLSDLTLSKNRAYSPTVGPDSNGGGLYNKNATVRLTDSKVIGNSAVGHAGDATTGGGFVNGGGIWSAGNLTITDSVISGNLAQGGNALASSSGLEGGGVYGAGIYARSPSKVDVHQSIITGNKAIGGNGSNGAKGLTGATGAPGQTGGSGSPGVQGGDAGSAEGGGIYARFNTTFSVFDSTISGNTVKSGNPGNGGAGGKGGAGGASYTVGGVFHHAGAGGDGGSGGNGGIGVAFGGGLYNDGTLDIHSSTISGNTVRTGKTGMGGAGGGAGAGSYTDSGVIHHGAAGTHGTNHTDNIAYGGGVFSKYILTLSQVTIANNSAIGEGGGVLIYQGTATIDNSTIAKNKASLAGGGLGVLSGSVRAVSSIIALNSADNGADASGSFAASFDLFGILTPSVVLTTNSNNIFTSDGLNLGKLAMNGGTTATMQPSSTSSALNAGSDPDSLSTGFDQRGTGFSRLLGGVIDIGAVEIG